MNNTLFWLAIIIFLLFMLVMVAYLNHVYQIEAGYLPIKAGR